MKFMVVWKTVPGKYKTALDQFLKTGAPAPAGGKTVGRWHVPGSTLGWHLIEASGPEAHAEHAAEWSDVLQLEIYPVLEDAEAAAAAKKVLGK
ncbi:MAG: DUF3303 family protein [Terracidiphilus sp.]|jgi:hypothetical protein